MEPLSLTQMAMILKLCFTADSLTKHTEDFRPLINRNPVSEPVQSRLELPNHERFDATKSKEIFVTDPTSRLGWMPNYHFDQLTQLIRDRL